MRLNVRTINEMNSLKVQAKSNVSFFSEYNKKKYNHIVYIERSISFNRFEYIEK